MDNELRQYIELFEENREVIESNSPSALNKRRDKALATLKRLGNFPKRGEEGYPLISINEMFAPDYGVNITRMNFATDGLRNSLGCLPGGGATAATVVNDSVVGCRAKLPEGVEVCSFVDAAVKYPEIFEKEIAAADNAVVALNDLLVQDGVFIRFSSAVTKPVQILSVFNSAHPFMGVRRILIHVDDGASGSVLLCDHPLAGAAGHLSCRVVEAKVGENARLDLYDLEEAGADSRRASVFASEQKAYSRLNVCSLFLNGGTTRNEFYPRHCAPNCETRIGGLVIGGGTQVVDNSVMLTHTYPRCKSEQLFKYALFDSAKGSFEGMVKVEAEAVHTDAHQSNRNLLASPGARMYAMPQLEIYCDEVKASHGSATGQLDERALFYMRQRGIPENEARMMLINAFMTDVLDTIADETLRERLRHLVDVRLRGAETVCSGCKN